MLPPRRIEHSEPVCQQILAVFSRIGDKWSLITIVTLSSGALHFNELKRRIFGISQRMLTRTLRNLERDGIIIRAADTENTGRIFYLLTELGKTLLEPVGSISEWAVNHGAEMRLAQTMFDQKKILN